jgi:hypothetical protein
MSTDRSALSRELLDRLEREEEKLLSWGVVDGGFTADEVAEMAEALISERGADISADELRQELFDRKLLFAFADGLAQPHRTRMAEAVRLFAKLRQLFPNRPWRLAPTLVADYRFARRARRYPRREIEPARVIERLSGDIRLSPGKRQALSALLRVGEREPLRLAEFQVQATRRMLLDLEGRFSRALIIGAGTGTGKTLAFYIPALAHISGLVERSSFWTKALAIYPRNELLKDQFSETYVEARRLDLLLHNQTGRKLTIGAFFGPTPREASELTRYKNWGPARGGGFVCPFLRCPRCEGDLLWRAADVDRGVETLHCERAGCGAVIADDEVLLTRDRMAKTPPDVLFTTTEMLNRQMGNSRFGHVFGLGPGTRRPHLMLLDEAHTYSGTSGAQVALLLRRFQHAVGSKMQFTGLSATLRGAAEFFGQLVGLPPGAVEEVSPKESELDPVPESVEYVLALRGDPASATSLLSTSIQTAMLLRRVLDPAGSSPSAGLYGSRVFLFTDDLDVTNRLYNNLQDAEGLDSWNRPQPAGIVLASLRSTGQPENNLRLPAGQSWQLCEDIGHPIGLARPIRLSRTSSQDVGVERGSDIVVATAALEVGYNDPDVGAVMQHKAPRDWAAFLQRKGRAGRRREMRPWTAVVLSDYGRDRTAYQSYDQIFDPELPLRSLPVGNRYVLRMQAAFALMDWVARELPAGTPPGSVWTDFSGPDERTGSWAETVRQRQDIARRVLGEVLDGNDARCRSLESYLRAALGLGAEEMRAVLWDPPRAVMTSVIPTLFRRLETGWRRVQAHSGEPALDCQVKDHPLPDFVPQQLFGDLNLPEVEIVIDPQQRGQQQESLFLPIVQAMRTLAPGRVTRRFGYRHAFAHHWAPPADLQTRNQSLAVESYLEEFEEAGTFQVREGGTVLNIRCVRPWKVHPRTPPGNVNVTSNAQLEWRSQLFPAHEENRLQFTPPRGSPWESILEELRFYTHNERNHVLVRRFAVASHASLSFRDGSVADITVRFVDGGANKPAAVGFAQEVDGVVFRFRIPCDLGLSEAHPNRRKLRAFRAAYFHERVRSDPTLEPLANGFELDWLAQIYLSALAAQSIQDGVSAEEAQKRLHAGGAAGAMADVLGVIFQSIELPGGGQVSQRVHDSLLALCRTGAVTDALGRIASVLWLPLDADALRWAALRYKATIGGALLEACQQSCPRMETGDLYLDIDPGPRPPGAPTAPDGLEEVWITESTIGGGGVVEEVLRAFASDPRRFFRTAESALAATDFEIIDREITRILGATASDAELNGALAAVRASADHATLTRAAAQLRGLLSRRGVVVNHSVMSAVFSRVLRPGSSPATDGLLRRLATEWNAAEDAVGVEIDTRVYAYLASCSSAVQADLAALGVGPAHEPFWRFQTVYGLLWPRGYAIRSQGLSFYNPFADAVPPDRELLLDLLRAGEPTIPLAPGWEMAVGEAIAERGAVRLTARPADRAALKQALLKLAAEPVEAGFLHLYPNAVAVAHDPVDVGVTLDLREVLP